MACDVSPVPMFLHKNALMTNFDIGWLRISLFYIFFQNRSIEEEIKKSKPLEFMKSLQNISGRHSRKQEILVSKILAFRFDFLNLNSGINSKKGRIPAINDSCLWITLSATTGNAFTFLQILLGRHGNAPGEIKNHCFRYS